MRMPIKEADLLGYLLELIEEYANHGVRYVKAYVDEDLDGKWTFSFTFKFTRED